MASIPCAIHLYPLPSSSSIATAKRQPSSFWCIILSSLGLRLVSASGSLPGFGPARKGSTPGLLAPMVARLATTLIVTMLNRLVLLSSSTVCFFATCYCCLFLIARIILFTRCNLHVEYIYDELVITMCCAITRILMQYFKYMGMFAVEGSYDRMEALMSQNIHPVDILLIMAACKGDKSKIEELLRAGASFDVKDVEGRTAVDRASNDEIKDFILRFSL